MMASSPTLSPAIRDDDALPTASLDEPPLPPSLAESEPSSTDRYHDTLKRMTQGIEEIGKSMGIIIERLDEDAENDVEKERKRDLLQDGEQFEIHQVIPEVKEFDNWKDFKNQFSENEDRYVIEALVMGSTLLDEQEQEKTNRLRAQLRAQNISNPLKALLKPELQVDSPRAQSFARNGPGNHRSQPFIQQVRLLTPAVIAMLKILSNGKEGWDHSVLNFKPPFRSFVHFHPQMLQELKRLEATARRDSTGRGAEAQIQNQQDPDPSDEFPHGANVPSALKQFRCYVGFVEERILPLALHFQHDESGQEQALKIRYHDLSYLFQPGQLVHVPHTSDSLSSGGQTLWRVYHVLAPGDVDRDRDVPFDPIRGPFDPPRGPYDPPRGSPRVGGFDTDSQKALKFTLKCYYLDFNGQKYGAVCKDFIIGEYRDEKDIKTLPIFPLRYLDQWSTYLEKACSDGKKFLELISNKYGSYSGWTLMSTPSGELRRGRYVNEPAMHPEHIDSDILVDFNEAYNHFPQWNPPFAAVTRQQIATVVEWDAVDYYVWNDPSRLKITSKLREKVVESDGVSHVQYNDFLDKDEFLRAGQGKLSESTEEHLALLPDRMVVYALWERKFVQVDARLVRLTQSSEKNPFDSLEIENTHRQMIQSIVHEHFQLKRIEDIERHGGLISQDIIGNKGKGTVILLHGVPGVGKTATAEAVAQKWHRPLFPITCGDLGMSAREVETSLGEIFRLVGTRLPLQSLIWTSKHSMIILLNPW